MKKTVRKWLLGFGMMVIMLCCQNNKASAAEVKEVNIEGYRLEENRMHVYFNTDAATEPTNQNLSLFLGDWKCEAVKVSSFDSLGEGVSYLVLVDVSGSVTQSDLETTKEILKTLVDLKTNKDNLSIMEIKNEIEYTDFSSDKELLLEQIQNIERTKEDTNLYLAIREGLKLLAEEEDCFEKKCMIIFSDGMDDQKNGILFEDVRDSIKNSNVPICTLAMLFKGNVKGEEAPDKVMKSFTDNGAGGLHVRLEDSGMEAEEIATLFSQFSHSGLVAEVSLEGFETNGSQVELNIGMKAANENIQSDSYTIPSYEIASVLKVPVEEVAEEVLEVEEETKNSNYLFALLAGGIFLVVATILVLINKKKEGKSEVMEEAEEEQTGADEIEGNLAKKQKPDNLQSQNQEETENGTSIEAEVQEAKSVLIELTEIGPNSNRVLKKQCTDMVTIGRRKNADLVIAEDLQVSGQHCKLILDGDGLYIQDLESTNGTFLNGVPLIEKTRLSQDDILFIGSFEYRISWE
ncbi:MAG: FHA domain-containing protein [Lachnospiraceae bacterium]|nr:FHA domain-containing protein [Lachnospiraceae bacterium]